VPKLTTVIKSLNADMPWYTTAVIGISDFMAAYCGRLRLLLSVLLPDWHTTSTPKRVNWNGIR
jgi:type II secretory pathway component PulF